ncbi:MAG TPA: methionine--tRNA ligase [Blastocatellia bacterium]|nr:methionine--tRNA ligase [Blastocatellia bacterium]
MNKTFYVTTPIYYVNSYPHLGHLYTTLIADTVARYKRQRGFDVFFLTGTDEHGQNIERAAEKAGLPVKAHVDNFVSEFRQAFAPYHFTFNHWVRTTDDYHKRGVQELWRRAKANGWIYKGQYEGWYCVGCNEFKPENETHPGPDGTPICNTHERPLDKVAEESYFFKLSAFQDRLLELYETNPHFIRPETRRNEVISFVKGGLNDLSVSRVSVKWGIPVPDDPDHTMYVWFDALSNYITAIGFANDQFGGEAHFNKYWPADLQLVGKDILRFHTVYWPAFLLAAGLEPPQTVFSHGMWLSGGRKMSKTLGNVIDLGVLKKYFQTDAVRYFCLREMVFGQDGDFTYEALIDRTNADLASGLGNLSSRTLTMIRQYCNGEIPSPGAHVDEALKAQGEEVRKALLQAREDFEREFDNYNFSRGLEALWSGIARVDKFISDLKPWELYKTGQTESVKYVLNIAFDALRHITVLLAPVLPETTRQIWNQFGDAFDRVRFEERMRSQLNSLNWGDYRGTGSTIGEVKPVFPRLDKKKIMEEIKKDEEISKAAREQGQAAAGEAAAATAAHDPAKTNPFPAEPAPGVAYISIEDFLKVELRAGEIKTAERVPKADKLLRFTIDLGEAQPRQILAGIAQYYEPEKLIGRKVIVVANLAPRKLRGFDSQGMILAASIGEEGRPVLAGFLEEVPNGAKLK